MIKARPQCCALYLLCMECTLPSSPLFVGINFPVGCVLRTNNFLNLATHIFLKNGYNATSLGELVSSTGVNRHNIYSTFVDKEGLFLACVQHYTQERRISACLEAGIENNEISKSNNVQALTNFVSCLFMGLMNMAKNPSKKSELADIGNIAMLAIKR